MNPQKTTIAILAALSASLALADDFKTMDGKEYKDATVSRVEPDGIVVRTKSGMSKLYFAELPQQVQRQFNYDPQQARAYSAQQSAAYSAIQKDQEQAEHQPQGTAPEDQPGLNEQPATNTGAAGQGQRPTPFPRYPRRYTTVLHQLPQTQQPKPTAAPPPPKPKPPAPHAASTNTHPKSEGKKKHK